MIIKLPILTFKKEQWKWLYAPSKAALGLAVRTSFSSILSLYIALWMEMSSPFWAPLTVWMLALITPEESNSKARWHLFGTILGTIAAIASVGFFPQQAALFMISLALWVGGCCFIASFLNNFRVHGMRVSAFTYALIAIDAIPDPNQIFNVAMARASYIILAIILQKLVTSICVGNQKEIRIQWLQDNLTQAITKTCFILSSFFRGNTKILEENKNIFSIFFQLNQQSEFADMAISPNSHLGAHGRMILAIANNILLKTFCLQKLASSKQNNFNISQLPEQAAIFFYELPNLIKSNENVQDSLVKIKQVKKNIFKELQQLSEKVLQHTSSHETELFFTELSIIYDSLIHLEYMFIQFDKSIINNKRTYFSYHINTYRNIRRAFYNGTRVFFAIILASIIWQITAWNNGSLFVMYVSIISAITSITERPEKAARNYLNGACYAIICTMLINFILIPPISNFEILIFIILPFMFIAGLASCYAPIALTGIAFNFLFSVLISYNNQNRIDEITYFNLTLALISAIIFTWIICRLIFPINDTKEYFFTCKQMIKNLQSLPTKYFLPTTQQWIDQQVSNLVYIINDTKNLPKENQEIYFYGAQSIILIGIQIVQLRKILSQNNILPKELQSILKSLLQEIKKPTSLVNTNTINHEYQQLLRFISELDNPSLKKQLLPILSYVSIIKNQLHSYIIFIKLFNLSHRKYFVYL